ncbi:MAG: YafY family transcriptional regulator [Clostridiales bacterium]|nr:YafY family transcriptional regulator [Clostridiales bacterium]
MQIGRLFEIVYLLLSNTNITARELAERFEVSERTIYRDVDTLSQAGIPIYTERGRSGGIRLMEHFVLNKSVLSQQEREQILASLHTMNAVHAADAGAVLARLSSLFGEDSCDWIEIDFSSWTPNNPMNDRFSLLRNAILHRKVCSFAYTGVKGEGSQRTVEPVKLLFKAGAWYLHAYCREREAFRFFKLTRMRDVQAETEQFDRREPPSAERFPDAAYPAAPPVEVTARVSAAMGFRVFDEFDQIQAQEDGSFLVTLKMPEDQWLYSYLLSFGPELTVLSPQRVRRELQKKCRELLEHYNT